jgi:large subunit ribosomal protein L32
MPVPKRKTSKRRRDQRSSSKFIRPQSITQCSNCSSPLAPHTACFECGFYRETKVLRTKGERTLERGETRRAKQAEQEEQK